jgi:cell division protein FtsZ
MGGGTGTGAAPIIAGVAKRMGILTVGIVTIPFVFEGEKKIYQALEGVEELKKNVDALLVINNERLREIYFDLDIPNAFKRADNTLTVAVKSISEIITITGYINMDFADVNTILKNGGVALMSYGLGKGENRVSTAIEEAKRSPLLNNDDIFKAKKILLNITYDTVKPLMMEEMQVVHDFMGKFSADREVIWGTAYEPDLEENVKVTILATGFSNEDTDTLKKAENGGIIGKTDEEIQHEKEEVERKKELMIKYYKEDINSPTPKPFVFKSLYNMDDDEIIEALLKYPTYNRKPQLIPNIVCKLEARRTATVYNEKEKNNS